MFQSEPGQCRGFVEKLQEYREIGIAEYWVFNRGRGRFGQHRNLNRVRRPVWAATATARFSLLGP